MALSRAYRMAGIAALLTWCSTPAHSQVGPEGWRKDLQVLVGAIKAVHPRPFHWASEAEFDSAARSLETRLPGLTDEQAATGLMRLVAMVRDGHTVLEPAGKVFPADRWYPVRIDRLADGFFIVATAPAQRALLGARVLAVGGHPIEFVWDSLLVLAPGDNVFSQMARTTIWMMMPRLMAALGLGDASRLSIDVDQDGRRRTISVGTVAGSMNYHLLVQDLVAGDSSVGLPDRSGGAVDLTYRHDAMPYWFSVDSSGTLFAQVNLVSNADSAVYLDGILARIGLRAFGDRVLARIDSGGVRRVILDLRNNAGGNNNLIVPFVAGLAARSAINSAGHLFVITGRRTYSAAMNFTSLLEDRTSALFVGEPPGGRPSHYGDATTFVLPASGLKLNVSTLHWDSGVAPTDVREEQEPDLLAPPTMADLRAGRDPAISAIRDWKPGGTLHEQLRERFERAGIDSALNLMRSTAPDQATPWNSRAQQFIKFAYDLFGARGTSSDIGRVLELTAQLYPDSPNVWFELGRINTFIGRGAAATVGFERALRLRPNQETIRRFYEVARRHSSDGAP